jgi:hypothetical protein
LELRTAPATLARVATDDSMLAALGYTGEESESVSPDAGLFERLTLPPPGAR